MKNSDEQFYYEITEKEHIWKGEGIQYLINFIRGKALKGHFRVLEIGCGIAGVVPYLPANVEYVGTDVSDFALARARNMYPEASVNFINASADALPFKDSSFDLVLAFNVIEHCRQPKVVLNEVLRVIRSGGSGFFTGPNLDFPFSLPNGVRHRGGLYKTGLVIVRIFDYILRIFGYFKFRTIPINFTEATGRFEKPDDDLRYLCSSYEIIEYLKRKGAKIGYINPFIEGRGLMVKFKKIITNIPAMRYYGRPLTFMFQKM